MSPAENRAAVPFPPGMLSEDDGRRDTWIIWLVAALLLGAGELHARGLFLAPLAAARTSTLELRTVLDEATGKWGIRINRVEIKSVDPPPDIKTAMEKQMRAERDRRAAILTAEGDKQAQILTAEGAKQSAVLKAEGARQAAILRNDGEAQAIATVFDAIHKGDADKKLLSYQYLRMLPELARGEANTVFVIPSEFSQAFADIGHSLVRRADGFRTNGSAAP